jgi:hypothetical protein
VLELGLPRTSLLSTRAFALQDEHPRGISQTNWIIFITMKMTTIAAETCWWEFSEQNTLLTMKNILLVIYILWILLTHGRWNILKCLIPNRQKLHSPTRIQNQNYQKKATIWLNKMCQSKHLTSKYINITVKHHPEDDRNSGRNMLVRI